MSLSLFASVFFFLTPNRPEEAEHVSLTVFCLLSDEKMDISLMSPQLPASVLLARMSLFYISLQCETDKRQL